MKTKLNMDLDQYRDLIKMLNEGIYKYAENQGIDLNNVKDLISFCSSMKKIKLGKKTTEILLDGIMNYDVGDRIILKFIDLEGISFADKCVRRIDFRGTNADIDPQTVKDKNIEGAIFEGIDMSDKCFDGCVICHTNLRYTNAKINPQKVYDKDLSQTKCDGLDLQDANFKDVFVEGASFKNAKINLDPQTVAGKNLEGTNFENVDMSDKDFNGCNIAYCNLTNTNAVLNLQYLNINELWGCKLQGTTLLVGEGFNKEQLKKQYVELGQVKLNDYTKIKRKIKSIFKTINR